MRGRARLWIAWTAWTALAQADPRSLTTSYSPYELEAMQEAARDLGTEIDPAPEGKLVERVEFVRLDPVDPHDPMPRLLDALHTTSRASVLALDLLVREGDRWSGVRVDESARNLRRSKQLSLVLAVPMRGSAPDRVRLVVITKDVWSLYPDFDVEATAGGLERLDLEPKETNVAGLHHTAIARFTLQPDAYALGGSYRIPKLDGRRLSLLVDANVIVNRSSGAAEGSFGSAIVTRPLWSSEEAWSWSVGITWKDEITRLYSNAALRLFEPAPPATTPVPWAYRSRNVHEEAYVTRSFGWSAKHDLSFGLVIDHASYHATGGLGIEREAVSQFERAVVPVGEDRVQPFVEWHAYANDYLRIVDFDTLGLQEDYRIGHDVLVRAYPVLRAFGSSRDLAGASATLSYGVPMGDGLARASFETKIEAEPERIADASFAGALGIVTPRFGVGRLVFTATALNRWRNYLNARSFLGSESRLRGYPSRFADGKDLVVSNLELRSRPLQLATVQLGAALFYDVGDAFVGFDRVDPKQSLGFGFRAVFPQIERAAFRVDVGFPVSAGARPPNVPPVSVFATFGQAISLPGSSAM